MPLTGNNSLIGCRLISASSRRVPHHDGARAAIRDSGMEPATPR
jgi:hypothetical protein